MSDTDEEETPYAQFDIEGQGVGWSDLWVNGLEHLGEAAAKCVPHPNQSDDWQAIDPQSTTALRSSDLDAVCALFSKESDLQRWSEDDIDEMQTSTLSIAFSEMVLSVLQHLFELSPVLFMQQLGMPSGDCGWARWTPLSLVCTDYFKNGGGWHQRRREHKGARLAPLLQWLCRNGLMTRTLLPQCFGQLGGKLLERQSDVPAGVMPEPAKQVLQQWQQLSDHEQDTLTIAAFAHVLPASFLGPYCEMPWSHERLIWAGAQAKNSCSVFSVLSENLIRWSTSGGSHVTCCGLGALCTIAVGGCG